MKKTFIYLLMFWYGIAAAQDPAVEYENLKSKHDMGIITHSQFQAEVQNMVWLNSLDPPLELPYDKVSKRFNFRYTDTIPGISKELFAEYLLQYSAINYGVKDRDSDYLNIGLGKLITQGITLFLVNKKVFGILFDYEVVKREMCNFILVADFDHDIISIEMTNIFFTYDYYSGGGTSGGRTNLYELYPYTNLPSNDRRYAHELVTSVVKSMDAEANYIFSYIKSEASK